MRPPRTSTALAALLAPVAFAGYCYALGYDQVLTDVVRTTRPGPAAYLGALVTVGIPVAVVGATAAAGWRFGLRLPAAGAVLGLLAVPWIADVSPGFGALISFGTEVTVLAVVVLALAGLEYALRRRVGGAGPAGGAT